MTRVVIDTNILLLANNQHEDVSLECVEECVRRLLDIQQTGIVVIDDGYRLIHEYQHKTRINPPKGVGDVFLKWLLRNTGNPALVEQVVVHETGVDEYLEFPVPELQQYFDPSDRKFVAVAAAHPDKLPIWQGVDCKWLNWWPALRDAGIRVEFLCPADACRFYQHKFPDQPHPVIPEA